MGREIVGVVPIGGNIKSVLSAFGGDVLGRPSDISDVSHVVIPGVGSFASIDLSEEWRTAISFAARAGTNILGICLGMQFLGDSSEEGGGRGLGLIPGKSIKLPRMRMGWDVVPGFGCFYFCHQYQLIPDRREHVLCRSSDGVVAGVKFDNIVGVQFHPEKSQKDGRQFIEWFLAQKINLAA